MRRAWWNKEHARNLRQKDTIVIAPDWKGRRRRSLNRASGRHPLATKFDLGDIKVALEAKCKVGLEDLKVIWTSNSLDSIAAVKY